MEKTMADKSQHVFQWWKTLRCTNLDQPYWALPAISQRVATESAKGLLSHKRYIPQNQASRHLNIAQDNLSVLKKEDECGFACEALELHQ